MANELRDKLVELFAITSLEFEDAVVLANYLVCNGVTIPVRCKECKNYKYRWETDDGKGHGVCDHSTEHLLDDSFCSYGERKTDG